MSEIKKPLRIFNTPWHVAHQYELYKLPNTEWYQIINNIRKWSSGGKTFRPMQDNITQVPYYEPGKYDLAVLHVDQQCIDEKIGKSRLYRELNEEIQDIPKIVLNHGTPFWPEYYETEYIKTKMRMLVGNNHMVCNSHRAEEMWGPMGASTRTIIHGLDPKEWLDLPKEPRVITTLSPGGLDRYYNRKLLDLVKERLRERGVPHDQITVDWIAADFDDYRNFIGRSLVYFNPTLESPMPRSRTEAMLSGCCVVTLANHGPEKFITNGVNGYLLPDLDPYEAQNKYNPNLIVDLLEMLVKKEYKKAVEVGQAGKKLAMEIFAKERYQADWKKTINDVLGYKYYEL